MGDIQRGVVKWFNDAKGFGFIEHTTGRDVFVHYSVIQTDGFKTLKDGEEVDYELSEGDKGLHAAKVYRAQAAIAASKEKSASKEKAAESLAANPEMVAPNLESGTVNTRSKSAAEMIEIERQTGTAEKLPIGISDTDSESDSAVDQ